MIARTITIGILLLAVSAVALPALPVAGADALTVVTGQFVAYGSYSTPLSGNCFPGGGGVFTAVLDGGQLQSFAADAIDWQVSGEGQAAVLTSDGGFLPTYVDPGCAIPQALGVDSFDLECASGYVIIDASAPNVSLQIVASPIQCDTTSTDGVCFSYNPSALTNACVQQGQQTEEVPTPVVGTQPQTVDVPTVTPTTTPMPVCIIGTECVSVPVPGATFGSQPETVPVPTVTTVDTPIVVPFPSGYVEVTFLCPTVGQSLCHVDL